jgi:hypothetical protein
MGLAASRLDWVAGFLDECWWSRLSQPNLHSFSEAREPLPLVEQPLEKDKPAPKAISCYGLCMCPIFWKGRGAAFGGRASRKRDKHALAFVVLPEARRARQEDLGVDLG